MPPSKKPLDLSPGAILHIIGFQGDPGFAPKNKYLVVVGWHTINIVLAFRITSQTVYAKSFLNRELVFIPAGTDHCLTKDSYVQCFHEVERLDVGVLKSGWEKGTVTIVGKIASLQQQILTVVENSDVLTPQDITDVLGSSAIAPNPHPPKAI